MYSDYQFYKNEYKGIAIDDEASYQYYAELASVYIEHATLGRATSENKKVKTCECRIADILKANNEGMADDGREVKSESVGGWSKTYAENKRTDAQLERKITATIRLYLGLTGMLYCGGI